MWTAPSCKGVRGLFERIACFHMSGLLMRLRTTAGQVGFRSVCSIHHSDLKGQWNRRSVTRLGSTDRTIFSSCKITHQLNPLLFESTGQPIFMRHSPEAE